MQAVSTNTAGTVTLKRVTPLTETWWDLETVTVTNYTDVATNLTRTVTNDVVRALRLRYLGAGVVESNEVAVAKNEVPEYPPWPDIVIVTNKVVEIEAYTNWTYQVATGTDVFTNLVQHTINKAWTNETLNLTLSGGYKTNAWTTIFWPGDYIAVEGTALDGGSAVLILEK